MDRNVRSEKTKSAVLKGFLKDFWLNILTVVMAMAAIFMAVVILYHALLRYSFVSYTALAGIYASEYINEDGELHMDADLDLYLGGYSYFLCDKEGKLIYYDTGIDAGAEELESYVRELSELIQAGELSEYDDFVIDLEGSKRGVYYAGTGDGGWSIVTMPYREMLRSLRTYIYIFSFILLMFIAGNAATIRRSMREKASKERLLSTIRALGNTYYGLYRVNYADGTYELVRGSSHVRSRMPDKGRYDDFIRIAGEVIEESAFKDFCDSFSIDNIKKLIENRARDFGGDFLRDFDGEYRWVNVSLRFDESLDKDEVLLCFREVNEQKRKQIQEREMLKDALALSDQNLKAKQSFFNNMSHDMRTPLNAILGMTELALERIDDREKVEDHLKKINYSGRQLLTLINDILDMSKAEQGRLSFNERSFCMADCISESLESFRLQALSQGKAFETDIDRDISPVLGDPDRIVQIVNNLVSNAVKFTNRGGCIYVGLEQLELGDSIRYTLSVKDDGIGMSQEFLPHLFEPYYQEDRFSSRNSLGTGLGMPIVRSLVTYMNGEINVKSEIDKGTEFTVVLTLLKAQGSPVSDEGTKTEEKAPLAGEKLRDANVLLVEDNEINMEIAEELLGSFGARVTKAWNGSEALEIFKASEEGSFDIILMDMQMPVMDGCEASRRIRALKRRDSMNVPIIAVTANAFAEDIAAQKAAGMNDSILKPIDLKNMVITLEKYLNRHES